MVIPVIKSSASTRTPTSRPTCAREVDVGHEAHEVADAHRVVEVDAVDGSGDDRGAAEAERARAAASSMSFMMMPPWMLPM